jgi:hypothetical protein
MGGSCLGRLSHDFSLLTALGILALFFYCSFFSSFCSFRWSCSPQQHISRTQIFEIDKITKFMYAYACVVEGQAEKVVPL